MLNPNMDAPPINMENVPPVMQQVLLNKTVSDEFDLENSIPDIDDLNNKG